jgi:RHH-type transcriptional regulator, rel operon repressor / antitoxin RelB
MTLTVRLDNNLEGRLDKLVSKTHRSKSFYIKEALSEYLNNREDYLLALAAFEKEEPTTSLLEVRKELGLED